MAYKTFFRNRLASSWKFTQYAKKVWGCVVYVHRWSQDLVFRGYDKASRRNNGCWWDLANWWFYKQVDRYSEFRSSRSFQVPASDRNDVHVLLTSYDPVNDRPNERRYDSRRRKWKCCSRRCHWWLVWTPGVHMGSWTGVRAGCEPWPYWTALSPSKNREWLGWPKQPDGIPAKGCIPCDSRPGRCRCNLQGLQRGWRVQGQRMVPASERSSLFCSCRVCGDGCYYKRGLFRSAVWQR